MNYKDGKLTYIRKRELYTLFLNKTATTFEESENENVEGFHYDEIDVIVTEPTKENFVAALVELNYNGLSEAEITILVEEMFKNVHL
jgi:hypothetical protein